MGPFFCKIIPWLQGVSVTSSVANLSAIAIDRYLAICQNINIKRSSEKRIRITIILMWIFSLSITSPWLYVFKYYPFRYSDNDLHGFTSINLPSCAHSNNDKNVSTKTYKFFSTNFTNTHNYNYDYSQNLTNLTTIVNFNLSRIKGLNWSNNPIYHNHLIYVCSEMWTHEIYKKMYFLFILFGLLYFLPMFIISSCYFMIWKTVCRRKLPRPFSYNEKSQDIVKKSKIKVAQLLLFVMILFAISWLPLYVYGFRVNFSRNIFSSNKPQISLDYNLNNIYFAPKLVNSSLIQYLLGVSDKEVNEIRYFKKYIINKISNRLPENINQLYPQSFFGNFSKFLLQDNEQTFLSVCKNIRGHNKPDGKGFNLSVTSLNRYISYLTQTYLCELDLNPDKSNITRVNKMQRDHSIHIMNNLIRPLTQWLGLANSCINPILYTFFHKKYREGFKLLLSTLIYKIMLCICYGSPDMSERIRENLRRKKSRSTMITYNPNLHYKNSTRSVVSLSRNESIGYTSSFKKNSEKRSNKGPNTELNNNLLVVVLKKNYNGGRKKHKIYKNGVNGGLVTDESPKDICLKDFYRNNNNVTIRNTWDNIYTPNKRIYKDINEKNKGIYRRSIGTTMKENLLVYKNSQLNDVSSDSDAKTLNNRLESNDVDESIFY
ncbi:unnamed protein product [Gordionus sp. m RMFG-2023]